MGTQVAFTPGLPPIIGIGRVAAECAELLFREHQMLVIDDVQWDADLGTIRSGLVHKRRDFKAPFIDHEPAKPVRKQVRNIVAHAERLFAQLYPSFKSVETRKSFRPMITGPEPLHFDTYGGKAPLVTAYINVSSVPRVYNIGPNFPTLVREQPEVMRYMAKLAVERHDSDLSYVIRQRTHDDLPPLGPDAPKHRVELAPGAIWFFNAKTVSHEVVYGEGVVGVSWEVPDCGAMLQGDLMRELT